MLKLKSIIISIILLIFFIMSCAFFPIYGKKEYINFIQENKDISINLRLNGYYYYEFERKESPQGPLIKKIHPIFLYKDGTVRSFSNINSYIYSTDLHNVSLEDNTYENAHKRYIKYLKDPSYPRNKDIGWGQYRVVKDTLLIKYFDFGPSNFCDKTLCESKSIILNDTTFIQHDLSCLKYYEINEERVYKFKKYSLKPDSTNWTHDLQKDK